MTEVVAALIWHEEKFLACLRPADKARALLWEFVGGKVEPGESGESALARECMEELGVVVSAGDVFMDTIHEYPDLAIHLTVYNAKITEGTPRALEHADLRWISIDEIDNYEFCPADKEILARIKKRR